MLAQFSKFSSIVNQARLVEKLREVDRVGLELIGLKFLVENNNNSYSDSSVVAV